MDQRQWIRSSTHRDPCHRLLSIFDPREAMLKTLTDSMYSKKHYLAATRPAHSQMHARCTSANPCPRHVQYWVAVLSLANAHLHARSMAQNTFRKHALPNEVNENTCER